MVFLYYKTTLNIPGEWTNNLVFNKLKWSIPNLLLSLLIIPHMVIQFKTLKGLNTTGSLYLYLIPMIGPYLYFKTIEK